MPIDPRRPKTRPAAGSGELERGREGYARRTWSAAYAALSRADRAAPLGGADLELLAVSAYLAGREDDFLKAQERAHRAYLRADESVRAARCAFWLALGLLLRGETGPSTGWLARAQRLLAREQEDCVERGYLQLPLAERHLAAGDAEAALAAAVAAVGIGERFGEADLVACARHQQGRALLSKEQFEPGLALLDEAMVAVVAGELSPLMTGLIYCSVIDGCQQVYALGRAGEWTAALARWCDSQPELVAFTGACLTHRAEIMQLHGAWGEAMAEARRACERFDGGAVRRPPADAFYRQGELHRLRGEFAAAEEAYENASRWGREPQPGLALLRLAQGRIDKAAAAIRRAAGAATDRLHRAKLLPAFIEVMLAAGDIEAAREASRELEEQAARLDAGVLAAAAAQAKGAVQLGGGDAQAALRSLSRARETWRGIGAPYEAARARLLSGLACRALGDEDGARLELEAAQNAFEGLGAGPDAAKAAALLRRTPPDRPCGLTLRELQVLRLVAAGKTNRSIAAELVVSAKTVDRHVSNILSKLDAPSRTAAAAFAYERKLV
jgi:DNA-binding CsgD family transcriptional regulator